MIKGAPFILKRNSNPNIVKFWLAVDRAAVDNAVMTVITERTSAETHGLKFACKSGMLFLSPSPQPESSPA
jgi:DNA polymerase